MYMENKTTKKTNYIYMKKGEQKTNLYIYI